MAYDGFGLFGPDGFPVVPPWHPLFQQPRQLRIPQDPNVSYSPSRSLCTYPIPAISWNVYIILSAVKIINFSNN